MKVQVVTLRYSPSQGVIDDAPLLALPRDYELVGMREYFFVVNELPHLLCVVNCEPRASPAANTLGANCALDVHNEKTDLSAVHCVAPADPVPQAFCSPPSPSADATASLSPEQRGLYEVIRRWRYQTAQRGGVPAYAVLTNRTLEALVRERPESLAALARIQGIGKAKVTQYGEILLALLRGEPGSELPGQSTTATPTLVPDPETSVADPNPGASEPEATVEP